MKSGKVVLLGCGDIGTAIARTLLSRGRQVLAVRRNTAALPPGIPALALDYTDMAAISGLLPRELGTVILTPTPDGRDPDAYRRGYLSPVRNLLAAWQNLPPQSLIYVSSTRVYGDASGAWVDEETPLQPEDAQAEILCEAEALLLGSHHRVTVVRFSGIYGRLPSRLLERIRSGEIVRRSPPHYSNRLHREDCVGFLLHLVDFRERASLYLASDDEPVLSFDVESWLARKLCVEEVRETIDPPRASRRCRNQRMKSTGYRLQYPDFRRGYSAMINSTSISAPRGSAAT